MDARCDEYALVDDEVVDLIESIHIDELVDDDAEVAAALTDAMLLLIEADDEVVDIHEIRVFVVNDEMVVNEFL